MQQHGGSRSGAGRPKGSGRYGEVTQLVRVPASMKENVLAYVQAKGHALPLYSHKVPAGFPSPADDAIEARLDLNEHLIKHPASTFLVRVSGFSMKNVGIFPDDILVVDRSLEAVHGKIVIAAIDGELTVKRLCKKGRGVYLMPENTDFDAIKLSAAQDVMIWGVVTNVIHAL